MRIPLLLAAAAMLATGLAGCSAKAPAAPPPDFQDLGLQATATTGLVRGLVVDQAIRPVGNATISLTPGNLTARTAANGLFGFDGLAPGTYFVGVRKLGFVATQTSATVIAGEAEPPLVRVQLVSDPVTAPYIEILSYEGFMTCGVAIVASSVGCDTSTSKELGDRVYFPWNFTVLPNWTQGELVWEQTQAGGGEFIWQIAKQGTNNYYSAGQTTTSPALASINGTVLEKNREEILKTGIEYRVFGGPHPACTTPDPVPHNYGCGLTLNQRLHVYLHSFYNFVPLEGWRFTKDGDPVVPT
jgi:hypothetical protein